MAVYEPDSSATAVILCKLTDISYKWGIESFRLVSEYKVKIKVLKPEGTSYADVIIPYYELPNNAMKENIIDWMPAPTTWKTEKLYVPK